MSIGEKEKVALCCALIQAGVPPLDTPIMAECLFIELQHTRPVECDTYKPADVSDAEWEATVGKVVAAHEARLRAAKKVLREGFPSMLPGQPSSGG